MITLLGPGDLVKASGTGIAMSLRWLTPIATSPLLALPANYCNWLIQLQQLIGLTAGAGCVYWEEWARGPHGKQQLNNCTARILFKSRVLVQYQHDLTGSWAIYIVK